MNQAFWTTERVAGGLLSGSLLILFLALIIMTASGAVAGFRPIVQGSLADVAPYVATFRLLILLFIVGWIVHLLGVGLLTRLLVRAGEEQLALLAFILILIAVITAILNFSFRMTVELWAAGETAQVASLPTLYEPLRIWTSNIFRLGYHIHFVAMFGIGWGILRTGLLAPWVGWATIGWSLIWLLGALVGVGAPAVPFLMPAVIGIAFLFK